MKNKFTQKKIENILYNLGYYLGCQGCDYEENHNINSRKKCTQKEMIKELTEEINRILKEEK